MNNISLFKITSLITKQITGKITPAEENELNSWIDNSDKNRELYEKYRKGDFSGIDISEPSVSPEECFEKLTFTIKKQQRNHNLRKKLSFAAAILIPIISATLFITLFKGKDNTIATSVETSVSQSQIRLTTTDGKTISITDKKHSIEIDNETVILNNRQVAKINIEDKAKLNSIYVPRGKDYILTLPDSSKVWINSETEIKFPFKFSDKERVVEISGEAYFEVTRDTERPFIVKTDMGNITVLGTSFNISNYPKDKNVTTTLVSGSVKFKSGNKEVLLKPNEQSIYDGSELVVDHVDANEFISWINGRYIFREQRMEQVVNVLSRWFNTEVKFDKENLKNIQINGSFYRHNSLIDILSDLSKISGLQFKYVEGVVLIK